MDTFLRQIGIMILCFLPLAVVIALLRRKVRGWRIRSKLPFTELRRRPAGEFLRVELELLDEKINERLLFLVGFPVILGMVGGLVRSANIVLPATLFLISLFWTLWAGWKLYLLIQDRRNRQLGFDGERFVGEELTKLVP